MEALTLRRPRPQAAQPPPTQPFCSDEWDHILKSLELSPQQARLVALMLQGNSDKQIAAEMGVRFGTVRTYLSRIFERTGTSGRAELTALLLSRIMSMSQPRKGPSS